MIPATPLPRSVTREDVEHNIKSCCFAKLGHKTTVCVIIMANGFEVVGSSACVDPEQYDQHTGQQYAYEDAFDKAWAFLAYGLQDARHEAAEAEAVRNGEESERPNTEEGHGHDGGLGLDPAKVDTGLIDWMASNARAHNILSATDEELLQAVKERLRGYHQAVALLDQMTKTP